MTAPLTPPGLGRDPRQETRTRRFMEILSSLISSLSGKGQLLQQAPEGWTTIVTGSAITDQLILANQIFGP